MYIVVTTVAVEPDSVDELAELFKATNRDLVTGQDDWLGAYFTADRDAGTITVMARWRRAESHEQFSSSDEFQRTMARFASRFVGPPQVSVNEVLVEM